MDETRKIELIAEVLDVESDDIGPESVLAELEEWDSMAKLSLMVMMGDECDIDLEPSAIREFVTVGDIMQLMH